MGGAELGEPRQARTVRRGGLVTDGPFAETKEHLGGFIVLEVPDLEAAIEVASGWPGLEWAGDGVELRPVGDSAGDAGITLG